MNNKEKWRQDTSLRHTYRDWKCFKFGSASKFSICTCRKDNIKNADPIKN